MVDVTIRLQGDSMLVNVPGKPDLTFPNTPEHFLSVVDEVERILSGVAYQIHCYNGDVSLPFRDLFELAEAIVGTRADLARYEDDGGFVL